MMRNVALFSALAFIALLTFLTVSVIARDGLDILSLALAVGARHARASGSWARCSTLRRTER